MAVGQGDINAEEVLLGLTAAFVVVAPGQRGGQVGFLRVVCVLLRQRGQIDELVVLVLRVALGKPVLKHLGRRDGHEYQVVLDVGVKGVIVQLLVLVLRSIVFKQTLQRAFISVGPVPPRETIVRLLVLASHRRDVEEILLVSNIDHLGIADRRFPGIIDRGRHFDFLVQRRISQRLLAGGDDLLRAVALHRVLLQRRHGVAQRDIVKQLDVALLVDLLGQGQQQERHADREADVGGTGDGALLVTRHDQQHPEVDSAGKPGPEIQEALDAHADLHRHGDAEIDDDILEPQPPVLEVPVDPGEGQVSAQRAAHRNAEGDARIERGRPHRELDRKAEGILQRDAHRAAKVDRDVSGVLELVVQQPASAGQHEPAEFEL